MFQPLHRGAFADVHELDVHHPGPVGHLLGGHVVAQHRVVGAAGGDPALDAGGKVRHRLPHHPGHRQVGHGQDGLDAPDVLADEPQPAAHVDEAHHDGVPLVALKHKAGGGLAVADAQRVHLDAGPSRRHAGADLQHVGPQAVLIARLQMVGVVLHEGGAAGLAFAHGLEDGGHGGHLPVALAAVAVALGHQVLAGKARQLLHAVEVLEVVGEGKAALRVQHLLHGDLFPGLVAHGGDVVGGEVVLGAVLLHQRVDLRFGHCVHFLHQTAHRPGVHLPAQLHLGLHLVALGHGNLPHVVAEAHDLQFLADGHAHGGAHPATQPVLHRLVLPVAGDDLAGGAQPCPDEAVLPVAVGGLVQVHEVHVDFFIGDGAVVLGGKMAPGLLQAGKAVDPHLRGAEGVAPGHDTGAGGVVVCLAHHVGNFLVGLGGDLVDQLAGQAAGGVQRLGHFGGAGGHRLQNLRPVEELAAHHEPEFILFHAHWYKPPVSAAPARRLFPPGCRRRNL